MRLIADGVVDREGVPGLARHLGYSTRHLQRLLLDELGAGPVAIARAQRAQTARVLTETTSLPLSEVAFAAGFSSVRQFNDTVRTVFGLSPSVLRSRARRARRGRRCSSTCPSANHFVPTTSSATSPPPPYPEWRRCGTVATDAPCGFPTAPG
jgi:AraC family transcriptional regulator of adaptative response / DNA-3-methyladenine glycosylase II